MHFCRSPRVFFHRPWLIGFVYCQRFHVGRCFSQKKKWTKDEISSLVAWRYETEMVYGPLVDGTNTRRAVSGAKYKAARDVSADDNCLNNRKIATEIIASDLKDDGTQTADFPYSTSKCLTSQTVSEDPDEKQMSPAVINSFKSSDRISKATEKRQTGVDANNVVSKQNCEDFLASTKREGTYGYTWVENTVPATKCGSAGNTVTFFTQTTNTKGDNADLKNVEPFVCRVSNGMNASTDTHRISDTVKEQATENNSFAAKVQTDENSAQNSSDQHMLTFPLFASSTLPTAGASLFTRMPSISAILKATMPPESRLALTKWEQRMIAELGEDGFKEYQKSW